MNKFDFFYPQIAQSLDFLSQKQQIEVHTEIREQLKNSKNQQVFYDN